MPKILGNTASAMSRSLGVPETSCGRRRGSAVWQCDERRGRKHVQSRSRTKSALARGRNRWISPCQNTSTDMSKKICQQRHSRRRENFALSTGKENETLRERRPPGRGSDPRLPSICYFRSPTYCWSRTSHPTPIAARFTVGVIMLIVFEMLFRLNVKADWLDGTCAAALFFRVSGLACARRS